MLQFINEIVIIQGLYFQLASMNELFSSVQLRKSCIPKCLRERKPTA